MINNKFIAKKGIDGWTAFLAWIFILIVPLSAVYFSINSFIDFTYKKAKWETKSQISLEIEKFKKDILPSSYLLELFNKFDKENGFEDFKLKAPNLKKYETLTAKKLSTNFEKFSGVKVACLLYYGPDTSNVSFTRSDSLENSPLRKPPSILVKRLFGILNNQFEKSIVKSNNQTNKLKKYIQSVSIKKARKDMQFFLQTYFGNIGSVKLVDKQIIRTISSKLGITGTTFFYYSECNGKINGKKANFGGYIAIVRLSDLSPTKIIKQATQKSFYEKFTRQLVTPKSNLTYPDDMIPLGIHEFKINPERIQLDVPIPQSLLVFLSQRGLFRVNYLENLKANFPLLRVFVNSNKVKPPINRYMRHIKVLFLLILLMGTALCIRLALFGMDLPISIKAKFILGISASLILPISILLFSNSLHNSFSNAITRSSLKNHMANKLLDFKTQLGNFLAKHEIENIELAEILRKKMTNTNIDFEVLFKPWLLKSNAEEIYLFRYNKKSLLVKHPNKKLKSDYSDIHTKSTIMIGNALLSNIVKNEAASISSMFSNQVRKSSSQRLPVNHLGELLSTDRNAPDSRFSFIIIKGENSKPIGMIIIRYSTQLLVNSFFNQPSIIRQLDETWREYKIDFNFAFKNHRTSKYDFSLKSLSKDDNKQIQLAENLSRHFVLEKTNSIKYYKPVKTHNYIAIAKACLAKNVIDFSYRYQLIRSIAYLFILFIFIMLLTHLFYVKPINDISNQLLQVSQGNLGHRCYLSTGDELEELANSFNAMTKDIAQKEQIEKFVSKDVLDDLSKMGSSNLKPGGDLIEASILFCEINDFTKFTSEHTANEVIELLNKFVSVSAKICTENNGVIDKIVEGSLLITFKTNDHAFNSCVTATQISLTMGQITSGKFKCHSGISTGNLISGKIGSATGKLDFTVIGDTVNMAARLKSMYNFGEASQILISNSTKKIISKRILVNSLGDISIKGKKQKQPIFELIDFV